MADLINHSKKYEKFIVPYAIPLESESKVDLKSHSGLLTFPEMYCWEDFEDIYEDQGASIFATQYELKVLPDSDRIAQEEWLQDWKVLPLQRQRLVICDPAGTEKKQNDPSGFLVVDISPEPRLYVLYAKQFWLTPYNVIEMLKTLDDVYKPDEIYVEKEKYSIGMMDTIDHYFDGTMFSFVEHSNEAPEKRIYRLKQWVETRRILFSDDMTDLKYQLLNYPDVKHDHLLVCLAYAVKVMNPPKKTKVLPYEEQVAVGFDAELEKMQRIWNRKGMDYDKYF